jgi:bisphosphoglycerate-dependent phosphoglycerate mutase
MIPNGEHIQNVVFLRHGVAKHNLLDPTTGLQPNLEDPNLFDPPLVLGGKEQALQAGEHLKKLGVKAEVCFTSPLTRCIQTATLAFLPGDRYTEGREEPKFFCTAMIREAYGKHHPDRRRNKSVLEVGQINRRLYFFRSEL